MLAMNEPEDVRIPPSVLNCALEALVFKLGAMETRCEEMRMENERLSEDHEKDLNEARAECETLRIALGRAEKVHDELADERDEAMRRVKTLTNTVHEACDERDQAWRERDEAAEAFRLGKDRILGGLERIVNGGIPLPKIPEFVKGLLESMNASAPAASTAEGVT